MIRYLKGRLVLAAISMSLLALSSAASAQATRTWVSGVGDDVNPCSRTAPCKTFAGAISKTAAGGEISVLDPGGFGAVTITKALTINGSGTHASILATSGSNGVIVNAGVNDVVVLRNLSINGAGTGFNGLRFLAGAALHLEGVEVQGFSQEGMEFTPSGDSELFVKDSLFRRNLGVGAGGIRIDPGVAGSALATLDNVRLENNHYGLRAETGSNVAVRNCVASGNTNNGFLLVASGVISQLAIDDCTISSNGSGATTSGVKSEGSAARTFIGNSLVTGNSVGLLVSGGGQIISFGNNLLDGNVTDGNPTSTVATR